MSRVRRAGAPLALAVLSLSLAGCIDRVSVNSDEQPANASSAAPSISADGNLVAFESGATNLSANDTDDTDVFVRDRSAGTTTLASRTQGTGEASFQPALSADGRHVAFSTGSSTLVAGDTNQRTDVFVFDRTSQTTTRVSVSSAEAQANDTSGGTIVHGLSISGDGRWVAFPSNATNLVTGDTNGLPDIFIRDTVRGTTTRIAAESTGESSTPTSGFHGLAQPVLSRDGSVVVFTTVRGDPAGAGQVLSPSTDVYLYRLATGTMTRVSSSAARGQARRNVSVTSDGRLVAFSSYASDLVPGDTNGAQDVFVRNVGTGATTRIPASTTSDPEAGGISSPTIDGDGRVVAFLSSRQNVTEVELWARHLAEGVTKPVTYEGERRDGWVVAPQISANGRLIAFSSTRDDLIDNDGNGLEDVFIADTPPVEAE